MNGLFPCAASSFLLPGAARGAASQVHGPHRRLDAHAAAGPARPQQGAWRRKGGGGSLRGVAVKYPPPLPPPSLALHVNPCFFRFSVFRFSRPSPLGAAHPPPAAGVGAARVRDRRAGGRGGGRGGAGGGRRALRRARRQVNMPHFIMNAARCMWVSSNHGCP